MFIFLFLEVLIQYMDLKSFIKKRVGTPREMDWKTAGEALLKTDGYDIVNTESAGKNHVIDIPCFYSSLLLLISLSV